MNINQGRFSVPSKYPPHYLPNQPMPIYSLPQHPQTWMPPQQMQPIPQQLYSLPMHPMSQSQQQWRQNSLSFSSMLPLERPPQLIQTLQSLHQVSYNNQSMPMQQVEEKTIVQSMHQNLDGNRNNISFPKSQIDQEFNKARFSKQDYDIRYNLTQNGYGANNLDFVFVQKQRFFPQFLNTIQHQNNQSNYCGVPLTTPMANNFALNYVAYPTLYVVASQEVGTYIPSPGTSPATFSQYQNVDYRATIPGKTPPITVMDRDFALQGLSRQRLFPSSPSSPSTNR